MTKESFVSQYLDEMVGLLLAAFSTNDSIQPKREENAVSFAKAGQFFIQQQKRARDLLGRMWESTHQSIVPTEKQSSPQRRTT